jgi:hypothetical protein
MDLPDIRQYSMDGGGPIESEAVENSGTCPASAGILTHELMNIKAVQDYYSSNTNRPL